MMRRVAAMLALVVVLAACGDGGGEPVELARVSSDMMPSRIEAAGLDVSESVTEETRNAFATSTDRSLWADGKLWELRSGDKLIGALQATTLVPKVDLRRAADRSAILHQVLPGDPDQLDIEGLPVWASLAGDKAVYLWFGEDMFEVLQIKGSIVDPEQVVNAIIEHQRTATGWRALPPEVFEEEEEALSAGRRLTAPL